MQNVRLTSQQQAALYWHRKRRREALINTNVIAANTDDWWDMTDALALSQGIDGTGGQPSAGNPVGTVNPAKGSLTLNAPATGDRPTLVSGGGVLLDGVDDGYNVSAVVTGVEYVIAALRVDATHNAFATLLCPAELDATNTLRQNTTSSASWRDPASGAGVNDFTHSDGTVTVNGVATNSFTYGQIHLAEFTSGSTTEKTYGAIGLAATGTRYFKGEILGLASRSTMPSNAEQTALRNAFASHYGVTL